MGTEVFGQIGSGLGLNLIRPDAIDGDPRNPLVGGLQVLTINRNIQNLQI